jgi:hypothetical protein
METQRRPVKDSPRITVWHGAVFFQIFGLLVLIVSAAWYFLIVYAPGSLSQYLPAEFAVNLTTDLVWPPIVAAWGVILYFTFKGKKAALIASLIYSLLLVVGVLATYASPTLNGGIIARPSLDDLVTIPIAVILIVLDALAYRSYSR